MNYNIFSTITIAALIVITFFSGCEKENSVTLVPETESFISIFRLFIDGEEAAHEAFAAYCPDDNFYVIASRVAYLRDPGQLSGFCDNDFVLVIDENGQVDPIGSVVLGFNFTSMLAATPFMFSEVTDFSWSVNDGFIQGNIAGELREQEPISGEIVLTYTATFLAEIIPDFDCY